MTPKKLFEMLNRNSETFCSSCNTEKYFDLVKNKNCVIAYGSFEEGSFEKFVGVIKYEKGFLCFLISSLIHIREERYVLRQFVKIKDWKIVMPKLWAEINKKLLLEGLK